MVGTSPYRLVSCRPRARGKGGDGQRACQSDRCESHPPLTLLWFAVDGVVEVHAFGAVPPPVAVNEVNAGTHHSEDHCGNNRNCMCLTYSREGTC